MSILPSHAVGIQITTTLSQTAPTGAIGRQMRQVQRELDQLLEAKRDSPTIRLKVADAREALAALQAQLPLASQKQTRTTVVTTETKPAPAAEQLAAPIATKVPPTLPPRPKAPAIVWPPRVRVSPLQRMRDSVLLASIQE